MAITRKTKQKEIIMKEIDEIKKFFTAEELFEKSKKIDKKIGLATIYRLLKEKREKKELYSYLCDGKHVYSKEKKSHCHFVCENSGKIIHFDVDSLDFLKDKIPGEITSFQIEVRGVCSECTTD
jgi:Fe2+ or Zn2+ uptake regulation protein